MLPLVSFPRAETQQGFFSQSQLSVQTRYNCTHQHYVVLHYIVLHYVVRHYIVRHYVVLHYIVLHYIVLYYVVPHYIVLHYIVLYYVGPHYVVLHYVVLHYVVLHYTTLYYTMLYYTMLYYTTLYYTILYHTIVVPQYIVLHYVVLHYVVLHYVVLHYVVLHYIVLHYAVPHYVVLHYIVLHYVVQSRQDNTHQTASCVVHIRSWDWRQTHGSDSWCQETACWRQCRTSATGGTRQPECPGPGLLNNESPQKLICNGKEAPLSSRYSGVSQPQRSRTFKSGAQCPLIFQGFLRTRLVLTYFQGLPRTSKGLFKCQRHALCLALTDFQGLSQDLEKGLFKLQGFYLSTVPSSD